VNRESRHIGRLKFIKAAGERVEKRNSSVERIVLSFGMELKNAAKLFSHVDTFKYKRATLLKIVKLQLSPFVLSSFYVGGRKVKWRTSAVLLLIDKSVATLGVSVPCRLRNAPRIIVNLPEILRISGLGEKVGSPARCFFPRRRPFDVVYAFQRRPINITLVFTQRSCASRETRKRFHFCRIAEMAIGFSPWQRRKIFTRNGITRAWWSKSRCWKAADDTGKSTLSLLPPR